MIMCLMRCRVISALCTICLKWRWKSLVSRQPDVYCAESFSQLDSGMLARPIFLFQLAMQLGFLGCFVEEELGECAYCYVVQGYASVFEREFFG